MERGQIRKVHEIPGLTGQGTVEPAAHTSHPGIHVPALGGPNLAAKVKACNLAVAEMHRAGHSPSRSKLPDTLRLLH